MRPHFFPALLPLLLLPLWHAPVQAADPLGSEALHAAAPGTRLLPLACPAADASTPLDLARVIEQALCHNPQTRQVWAVARQRAAEVALAQGAYLPSLNASHSRSRKNSADTRIDQDTRELVLSYLLYDFGARAATLESARQAMLAANAAEEATLQTVFLAALQAYYQALASEAALNAARENERASRESLQAANARYRAGSATPADRLQAQTAAAQAELNRIQAEGTVRIAAGNLAQIMGQDAHRLPPLLPPPAMTPDAAFERQIDELIATAKQRRPDLAAAEAKLQAAEADIAARRAAGRPTLSLGAAYQYADTSRSDAEHSKTLGLTLNIPLFSGFNTTYKIRAAEAQRDQQAALRDQTAQQVALDVWRAYHSLRTQTAAIRAADALLASAGETEKVAAGRYRAGVGGILDLLNAQSALANARRQQIETLYGWRIARATLAQAMGQLDFDQISPASKP